MTVDHILAADGSIRARCGASDGRLLGPDDPIDVASTCATCLPPLTEENATRQIAWLDSFDDDLPGGCLGGVGHLMHQGEDGVMHRGSRSRCADPACFAALVAYESEQEDRAGRDHVDLRAALAQLLFGWLGARS